MFKSVKPLAGKLFIAKSNDFTASTYCLSPRLGERTGMMQSIKMSVASIHRLIPIVLLFIIATPLWAGEDIKEIKDPQRKWGLGIGYSLGRFDTNFKFSNKDTGSSIFIDGEGTLGLDENVDFPLFYGFYRFNRRHGISFGYFGVNREATLLQINESKDLNLGDLTISAGVDAKVTMTDRSSFYLLSYNYTIFDDNRSFLFASFGLYGLDLNYAIDASGQIFLQGQPVAGGAYRAEASVFAPLPLLGIDAWFFFKPKWALGVKVSVVAGSYQDVSAAVLDSNIRLKYQFSKIAGISLGINYFNATVDINEPHLKTEVNYGFDGVALGIDIRI